MKKDRHSKGYYENYARNHPNWCKAHWYLSTDELSKLKEEYLNNKKLLKEFINYSYEEFANNYGYFYGFFLVKFIKNHYSNSKVLFYISNPNYFLNDIDTLQKDFDEFMISEFNKYN